MCPCPKPLTDDERRAAIIEEAKTWLRTPYHHKANIKGVGVDCAWLLIMVYVAQGMVEPFDPGDYPMDWMMHRDEERYLMWVEKFCVRVDEPKAGDIAVWRYGRTFSHGAIVVEWPRVIHAFRPEGQVGIADASKGALSKREVLFYSLFKD